MTKGNLEYRKCSAKKGNPTRCRDIVSSCKIIELIDEIDSKKTMIHCFYILILHSELKLYPVDDQSLQEK